MKQIITRSLIVLFALSASISSLFAVPAYPGWFTKTQPDGSTIRVRLVGDEFYSFWETEDGKLALEQPDGTFVRTAEAIPSSEQVAQRRKASPMYQSGRRKAIGQPTLAPKGLVILVQFANVSFDEQNDSAAFHSMMNERGYSYHGATGSAVDYFSAQSNGQYQPTFDVFGPVTLPHDRIYYGEEGDVNGKLERDMYIADFVIDAVLAADSAGCDFSQYDSDNDGEVDIVYLFYAGINQAVGGPSETIWPHNWYVDAALYCGQTHGTSEYCWREGCHKIPVLDGKKINKYVCSSELGQDGSRAGIGTLCHEFGHVIGFPDYYDTQYGYNEENGLTPGGLSIMEYGAYLNNEMTPPNYSIFDKYYMGWAKPKFLTKDKRKNVSLTTDYYDAYQITGGDKRVNYNCPDTVYYIENRQNIGWDKYLPSHGMIVWRVVYDQKRWETNTPNNEDGKPRYTLLAGDSTTTKLGFRAEDAFPAGGITSLTLFPGCELSDIAETDGVITFQYNGGMPADAKIDTTDVALVANWIDACYALSHELTGTIADLHEVFKAGDKYYHKPDENLADLTWRITTSKDDEMEFYVLDTTGRYLALDDSGTRLSDTPFAWQMYDGCSLTANNKGMCLDGIKQELVVTEPQSSIDISTSIQPIDMANMQYTATEYQRTFAGEGFTTVCLPFTVSMVGLNSMQVYVIMGKVMSRNEPTGLAITPALGGVMEPGEPYVVLPAASYFNTWYGEFTTTEAVGLPGLVGNLSAEPLDVPAGCYVLEDGQLLYVNTTGERKVGQYEAYIDMKDLKKISVRALDDYEYLVLPVVYTDDLPVVNTYLDKTIDWNEPVYNILGQPVDAGYKGIVIQNGRKYMN